MIKEGGEKREGGGGQPRICVPRTVILTCFVYVSDKKSAWDDTGCQGGEITCCVGELCPANPKQPRGG